ESFFLLLPGRSSKKEESPPGTLHKGEGSSRSTFPPWIAGGRITFTGEPYRNCVELGFLSNCLFSDHNGFTDEKAESRVYVGNLDLRITEATLIKMFSPYGTIISEDFLWHTRGPKRGEPRGFAFVQFSSKE
ncbi:Probable RNA-binding protein 18, partial [Linum grandiflorum]